MKKKILIPVAAVALLTLGATGIALADDDDCMRRMGYNQMGDDHDEGKMRGKHWKGMGKHSGFFNGRHADKNLDVAAVRDIIEGQIAWRGMKNLKVGSVVAKDDKTIVADVTTQEGSLVWKVEVDRKTGRHTHSE